MKTKTYKIEVAPDENMILGQSHFIKTVEDVYEIIVNSASGIKFGIAFCEASQDRLVRSDGNDPALITKAEKFAYDIGAGHSFVIIMKNGFPINILPAIKDCREIVRLFCATANPVEVLIAETEQGRGILGVIDGFSPLGIEDEEKKRCRHEFLRRIGYKR